jgi:acetyltransferase
MDTDPKAWERHITLRDGQAVYIRPIRAEDEALYPGFLAAMTTEDTRLRFFVPMNEFSHAMLTHFTHLDYAHAMAFIALDEATGAMLGVARLHNNAADDAGEYAVVVRSDLKGHGLGWQLMQLIIDYAKSRGLREIDGEVLRENKTMLDMCRHLGFEIESDPHDAAICDVKLML